MKLDRNNNPDGKGKYALVKLRNFPKQSQMTDREQVFAALDTLATFGMLDYGSTPETEFMVMRLKDKFSMRGLMGYHHAITLEEKPDMEYAQEILDMAHRAGPNNPFCKLPD